MPSKPLVTAIIVNYHASSCLSACLTHLTTSRFDGGLQIIVVNNSPADSQCAGVVGAFSGVTLLEPGFNLGFGPANNLALETAQGQFLLFVNPDTEAPPEAIQQCLQYLADRPRVAAVGPRFINPAGHWQPSARRFPSLFDKLFMLSGLAVRFPKSRLFGRVDMTWWDHGQPRKVDWVVGAFMMVRREPMIQLNGFDPRFFLYFEEMELCRRLAANNWEVHILPHVHVLHIGGVSSEHAASDSRSEKQLVLFRFFSECLYYGKYYRWIGPAMMLGLEAVWTWLRWLKNRLQHGKHAQKTRGFANHLALLKLALRVTRFGRHVPPNPWQLDPQHYRDGFAKGHQT